MSQCLSVCPAHSAIKALRALKLVTSNIFTSSLLHLRCVATGWGQTTKDGGLEDRLHQSVLRVQNNTDCGQVRRVSGGNVMVTGQCSGVQPEVRGQHHQGASLRRPRPRDCDWDMCGECEQNIRNNGDNCHDYRATAADPCSATSR